MLLVTSLTRVSGAIASVQTFTFRRDVTPVGSNWQINFEVRGQGHCGAHIASAIGAALVISPPGRSYVIVTVRLFVCHAVIL